MTQKKFVSQLLLTPEFRMSWPALLKAVPFQNKPNSEEFSVLGIFDPDNLAFFRDENKQDRDIRRVMADLAQEEWPDIKNVNEEVKARKLYWPVVDGDQKAAELEARSKNGDVYKGKRLMRLKAKAERPPELRFVVDGRYKVLDRMDDADVSKINSLFVAGNYAFAEINVRPTQTPQGRYMTLYLNKICFLRTGERIGGGPSLMDEDDVRGGTSDYDPTQGMSDDIPF